MIYHYLHAVFPNSRRPFDSQVVDAIDDELEIEGLVVDSKPVASKKPLKAAGQYKFPLATNRSNHSVEIMVYHADIFLVYAYCMTKTLSISHICIF